VLILPKRGNKLFITNIIVGVKFYVFINLELFYDNFFEMGAQKIKKATGWAMK
jgi:hypothetical protein